jgi:hypothetical protein
MSCHCMVSIYMLLPPPSEPRRPLDLHVSSNSTIVLHAVAFEFCANTQHQVSLHFTKLLCEPAEALRHDFKAKTDPMLQRPVKPLLLARSRLCARDGPCEKYHVKREFVRSGRRRRKRGTEEAREGQACSILLSIYDYCCTSRCDEHNGLLVDKAAPWPTFVAGPIRARPNIHYISSLNTDSLLTRVQFMPSAYTTPSAPYSCFPKLLPLSKSL